MPASIKSNSTGDREQSAAGQKRKSVASPYGSRNTSLSAGQQQSKRNSRGSLDRNLAASKENVAISRSSSNQACVPGPSSSRNILFEEEYHEDVVRHMHSLESQTLPNIELMDVQPELRWYMRPFLVDFLIEIHQTFRLRPETLYLTMNIVDRYVSKRIVYKRHYQLVGCAALLIAAKYEDAKNHIPAVQDLSQTCCNAYDETAFTQMEGHVLATIGWSLGFPTPEAWFRIACTRSREEAKVQSVARFLMEATLFNKDFVAMTPSSIAHACLMLARHICGERTTRPEFDNEAVRKTAELIDTHMREHVKELSQILIKKYSGSGHSAASKIATEWYAKQDCGLVESRLGSSADIASADKHDAARSTTPKPASHSSHGSSTDDDDESMSSSPTTPSSLSTMSHRSGHADDDDDDDDDEDDDDDDMPVTPLSLYSLHDPLAAAAASIQPNANGQDATSYAGKENMMQRSNLCDKHGNPIPPTQPPAVVAAAPAGVRPVLRNTTWDCNMQF